MAYAATGYQRYASMFYRGYESGVWQDWNEIALIKHVSLQALDLSSPDGFFNALHTELGERTCLFHANGGGTLWSGMQQGMDPDYYSVFMFNYVYVVFARKYPGQNWSVRTI